MGWLNFFDEWYGKKYGEDLKYNFSYFDVKAAFKEGYRRGRK